MKGPLVTVVLCTYNGAEYILPQIESILAQTYQPIELIISDDASTDQTPKLLKAFETLPNVKVYYQEQNLGLTGNFSFAANHANGQFIAFSDQDDIWLEQKVEKLVDAIGDKPLVYSNSLLINEKGKSLEIKLSDFKRMYSGEDSRGYILYSCVWGHGMMINRELLQHSMPMPGNVHYDIWLTYQAFLHGGIKYLDEVLTQYRQHAGSLSQTLPISKKKLTAKERYQAFERKLEWIKIMQAHERASYQPFYQELVRLFSLKEKKVYVFSLVSFMLKYRKYLFMLSTKGWADNLVEILKYGRGERNHEKIKN